jgi:hypothetical protein
MAAFANRSCLVSVASAGLLVCAALSAGCVTLDPWVKKHDSPPAGQAVQIAVTWDKCIAFVPDFTRGGAPNPGLLGRMYLFGAEVGFPVACEGVLVVELFDDTPLIAGGQSVSKVRWTFDKDTLKGCMRKDTIGWGYTFFLPWETYSPEIKQVHMMVRFTPQTGVPLFSPSETMVLIHPQRNGSQLARQGGQPGVQGTQLAISGDQPTELIPVKR